MGFALPSRFQKNFWGLSPQVLKKALYGGAKPPPHIKRQSRYEAVALKRRKIDLSNCSDVPCVFFAALPEMLFAQLEIFGKQQSTGHTS
jgi:hypothetical protein